MPEHPEAPLLPDLPAGWTREERDGYAVLAEPRRDHRLAFAESVARGLDDDPRWLSCTWLYDAEGSDLFERITEQPEYYQTRTENAILARNAHHLRERAGDVAVVELGSGSSTKTRQILDAWTARGSTTYVPIDVSHSAVHGACESLVQSYESLRVEGIASTYERGLPLAARLSPLMLTFLGSTVGNFRPADLDGFLDMVAGHLMPGDFFLLGIDQIKDIRRLEAAYNDDAGVTRQFTLNLFARINSELGSRVPLDAVRHVAFYNDRLERVEIYARFEREVVLELPDIDRTFRLAPGEMILTEISRKFRPADMAANLNRFGFSLERSETDPDDLFAVLLFRRRRDTPFADDRKARVGTLMRDVRRRTLDLLGPVRREDALSRHDELAAALVREVTEAAAFEESWLVEAIDRHLESTATPDPSVAAPEENRPPLERALERMKSVREEALNRLARASLDPTHPVAAEGLLHQAVVENEAHHQESMLELIQARRDFTYPIPDTDPPARPDRFPSGTEVVVPAGTFPLGAADCDSALDRERPQNPVEQPAFRIEAVPVTNGLFQDFIDDGGYRDRRHWSGDAWAWKETQDIEAPGSWRREQGIWTTCKFGRWQPLDPQRPVTHVSYWEAEAYGNWAGKRLPTESEWEKAAAWDPDKNEKRVFPWGDGRPTPELANVDRRLWEAMPAGSYSRGRSFYGCHQMIGDVWEWTCSPFVAYPGFEPFPDRKPSDDRYSEDLRVVRGGSWATLACAIRATTRRSLDPGDRRGFTGFRCARSL